MLRHFTELFSLTPEEALHLIDQAIELKQRTLQGHVARDLAGKTIGLLFEKPSLRTRVSFEAAAAQLGGTAIFLPAKEVGLGVRESIADFARVLSQYVQALAVRTYSQTTVTELARHATIPIINALSDTAHPCQAMADLMTVREAFGRLESIRLVFVGDGNNVARSLAVGSALTGVHFQLCCPQEYRFPDAFVERFEAAFPGVPLQQSHSPQVAVADCDVVYTDVWTSMGQEDEALERRHAFEPFRVDEALMALARPEAVFLHCLPAHRGEEVSDGVLDGPRSLVLPQAANRLHFQKALLLWLLARPALTLGQSAATRRHRPSSRRGKKTG